MPYSIQKSGRCYSVVNDDTKEVHAKCTSSKKAEAQLALLRGVEHGWKPTGKKSKATEVEGGRVEVINEQAHYIPDEESDEEPKQRKKVKKVKRSSKKKTTMPSDEVVSPSGKTWKVFLGEGLRGKKFGGRAEVNAEMKRLSEEYKKQKVGSGVAPLLLKNNFGTTDNNVGVVNQALPKPILQSRLKKTLAEEAKEPDVYVNAPKFLSKRSKVIKGV